ncbi:MAG: RrF2 family transcriptional regulator [Anaerolineae bacterium]
MAEVWRMSDAVSLAIHTMAYLAQQPERHATAHDIARAYGVSEHHLAKVHQRLTRAHLLESVRGPHGGVRLTMPAEEITLLRVYETIEGPIECSPCALGRPACGRKKCVFGDLVRGVQRQVTDYLANTTLAQLVE